MRWKSMMKPGGNFQSTLEDMGIREILEVYQNAYDEYAAGER